MGIASKPWGLRREAWQAVVANSAGKASSALRDFAPLVIFGVGRELDTAVLATLVGSILGSSALSVALPSYLPLAARGEDLRRRFHRFAGGFALAGVGLVLLRDPILAGLGLGDGQSLAYGLAIGSGVCLALSSGFVVRLHSQRTNFFALAVPAWAGPCVLATLLLRPSPTSYAAGLLLGSILDLVSLSALERRHRRRGVPSLEESAPVQNGSQSLRFLYFSQAVALVTVYAERGMAGRIGDGVVGAMAVGNRMAFGLVAVLAGSLSPELIRRAARAQISSARRWGTILGRLAAATALLLGFAVLGFELQPNASPLTVALAVYFLALPTMTALKAAQAILQGSSLLRFDFAVVVAGAVTTLGLAYVGLESSSVPVLVCATPLAACFGTMVASRQFNSVEGVGGTGAVSI